MANNNEKEHKKKYSAIGFKLWMLYLVFLFIDTIHAHLIVSKGKGFYPEAYWINPFNGLHFMAGVLFLLGACDYSLNKENIKALLCLIVGIILIFISFQAWY